MASQHLLNEKSLLRLLMQRNLAETGVEREKILAFLKTMHSSTPIDDGKLRALGEKFSVLNAMVAIYEAKASATLEDHLHRHNLSS